MILRPRSSRRYLIENPLKVWFYVNSILLARLNQRGHNAPSFSTLITTDEERVFAQEDRRFEHALNRVSVQVNPAIFNEFCQIRPDL